MSSDKSIPNPKLTPTLNTRGFLPVDPEQEKLIDDLCNDHWNNKNRPFINRTFEEWWEEEGLSPDDMLWYMENKDKVEIVEDIKHFCYKLWTHLNND